MPLPTQHISMVFQIYALFPNMTVAANFAFCLKILMLPADVIRQRTDETLVLVELQTLRPPLSPSVFRRSVPEGGAGPIAGDQAAAIAAR